MILSIALQPSSSTSPIQVDLDCGISTFEESNDKIGANDWWTFEKFNLSNPAIGQVYPSLFNVTYSIPEGRDRICTYGNFSSDPYSSRFYITDADGFAASLSLAYDRVHFENITDYYEWDSLILDRNYFGDMASNQWHFVASLYGSGIPNPPFSLVDRNFSMFVGIDLTPPCIQTIEIGNISEPVTVPITVEDLHCNIKNISIQIDDKEPFTYFDIRSKRTVIPFTLTVGDLSNGGHVLTITASDEVDNVAFPLYQQFIVDRSINVTGTSTTSPANNYTNQTIPQPQYIMNIYQSLSGPGSILSYAFLALTMVLKISKAFSAGKKMKQETKLVTMALLSGIVMIFFSLLVSSTDVLWVVLQSGAAASTLAAVLLEFREFTLPVKLEEEEEVSEAKKPRKTPCDSAKSG
jgi:hypothetical protein